MASKFIIGQKIVYLGTKEGKIDEAWEEYFGRYGVKKGTRGIINTISSSQDIFVKDDLRKEYTSGRLLEEDLMSESEYIIKFEKKLTKDQRRKLVNKIVKEIKANKSFSDSFKGDIKKEIESWEDLKLENWK